MHLPCPACGFLTVRGSRFGSYHICDACGWEDDGVQLANPACGGGANRESLIEAQSRALATFPLTVTSANGVSRDPAWRPLSPPEVEVAARQREERCWRNKAVRDLPEAYWSRSEPQQPPLTREEREHSRLWIPGRYCRLGVLMTIGGFALVFLTWNAGYAHGISWSHLDDVVLWSAFPLCGLIAGWSHQLSEAGTALLVIGMLAHWVVVGALIDLALARRARARAGRSQ